MDQFGAIRYFQFEIIGIECGLFFWIVYQMIQQGSLCKNEQHFQQSIRYICLEQTCINHRLLCNLCVRDSHRKHPIANLDRYIQPLARLGMNSQHQAKIQVCQEFKQVSQNMQNSFSKIIQLVDKQFQKLQDSLVYQLQVIAKTFSQEYVEQAEKKMLSGSATPEEIEQYVRIINLLSQKDFDNSDRLLQVLRTINKNMNVSIAEMTKKVEILMKQFQFRIKRHSLIENNFESIIQQTSGAEKFIFPQLQQIQKINDSSSIQIDQVSVQPPPSKKRKPKSIPLKQPPSIVCDSAQKDSCSEQIKIEDQTIDSLNEVRIGVDTQDFITQMKPEARSKVKRVVIGFCRNPQTQLSKILTLYNLEQLQINWYQLAKKEFLIKIINNLSNLKSLVLNCANQFDEECCRMVPKKLTKIRKLQYGWDFLNSLREYDEGIYFRISPYTNRGCPLKTSITREMVVGLKRLQNVWLGDFMYFRPSNNEIPFKSIKQFTLGQTKGKYFRIPEKLCAQLKDMRQLLSLAILHVRIDQKKLYPILANNSFIKTFLIEGCEDITDQSLKIIAKNCDLTNLSIRQSKEIEGTPIWEMQNLSTLVLVECSRIRVQEAILGLPKMRYLTYLNLYGNMWVTDQVVQSIPNAEHMQSLNLGRTSITDEALIKIGTMRSLKSLCLDCNKLTGNAIANLAHSIPQIQKISLWGLDGEQDSGNINDEDMEVIANQLTTLHHLSIRYCKKLSAVVFLNFKNLRFLQFDHQNLSNQVCQQLQKRGVKIFCDIQKSDVQEVQ